MADPALQLREVPDTDICWALLERIASSSYVKRASRLKELLLYLGECSLKDGLEAIHEQRIGVDIFGRSADYNTSDDNIVRTTVSELRKRVAAYFDGEGANETLLVEIPRGSYVPVFRYRSAKTQIPADDSTLKVSQTSSSEALPISQPIVAAPPLKLTLLPSGWFVIVATAIIIALSATCVVFRYQYRSLYRSMYPWQSQPTVAELWNDILIARPDTDIVLADASFGLLQEISKKSYPFTQYLNRSYISQLQDQETDPYPRAILDRIVTWNLGDQNDFKLARRILALDPSGTRLHLYNARGYLPDLTKRDNLILIGARFSNPWDDLFESHLNFVTRFSTDGPITVVNRTPMKGEQTVYTQTDSTQYCVISYQPNPNHNGIVLLIEGTNAEATEAAGDFLLSDYQLSSFRAQLHSDKFPYFEVLLKVSSVPGTPLTATIEAFRTYSKRG